MERNQNAPSMSDEGLCFEEGMQSFKDTIDGAMLAGMLSPAFNNGSVIAERLKVSAFETTGDDSAHK